MFMRYALLFSLFYVYFSCHAASARIQKRDLIESERWLFQELQNKMQTLQKSLESRSCNGNNPSGTTFTRWGRTECPKNNSDLVYSGRVGGSWYGSNGAAANYLCLPMDPDWDEYKDGVAGKKGYVFGTEYQLFDGTNDIGKKGFGNWDVPCSVCRTEGASSTLMIPGKTKCSDSWKREYSGYLMSGHANHVAATQYICVDRDFEKVPGSSANKNGALLYPIEARCGSLPCKPYVEGRELTCVVCSK